MRRSADVARKGLTLMTIRLLLSSKRNHARAHCLLITFLCMTMTANGGTSENEARAIAKRVVLTASQLPATNFLAIHRCEGLEDSLRSLFWLRSGHEDVFLFKLSDAGYEFSENQIKNHLSTEGPFIRYVAVSSSSRNAFRISGFKDSAREFNRMAISLGLNVRSEADALNDVEFYLKINPPNVQMKQIGSVLEAKQLAEKNFVAAYGTLEVAESEFAKWWSSLGSELIERQSYQLASMRTPSGYSVSFLTISSVTIKQGAPTIAILKVTLGVSTNGRVSGPLFVDISH